MLSCDVFGLLGIDLPYGLDVLVKKLPDKVATSWLQIFLDIKS